MSICTRFKFISVPVLTVVHLLGHTRTLSGV